MYAVGCDGEWGGGQGCQHVNESTGGTCGKSAFFPYRKKSPQELEHGKVTSGINCAEVYSNRCLCWYL